MRGPERVSPIKTLPLLPTTVVGGDPRPDWLVNRDGLTGRLRRAHGRRKSGAWRNRCWRARRTTPLSRRSAT